jgi:hypothetical protein
MSRPVIFSGAFAGSALIAVALAGGIWSGGRPLPSMADAFGAVEPVKSSGIVDGAGGNCAERAPGAACSFAPAGGRRWFIVGDSQARVLSDPLWQMLKARGDGLTELTKSGCPYMVGMGVLSDGHPLDCTADYNEQRRSVLLSAPPATVILNSLWSYYLEGPKLDNGEGIVNEGHELALTEDGIDRAEVAVIDAHLRRTVAELVAHGHRVVLVYPIPETGWNVLQRIHVLLQQRRLVDQITEAVSLPLPKVSARLERADAMLGSIAADTGALRVDPSAFLCGRRESSRCDTIEGRTILYTDAVHLSQFCTRLLATEILRASEPEKASSPIRPTWRAKSGGFGP